MQGRGARLMSGFRIGHGGGAVTQIPASVVKCSNSLSLSGYASGAATARKLDVHEDEWEQI